MRAVGNDLTAPTLAAATSGILPPARRLVDPEQVLDARRLHAREYVKVGYVPSKALGPDGTVQPAHDPWVPYSRHFAAFDTEGRVRATVRLIGDDAPWPLPTLRLPGIDPSARERLAGLPAGRVSEISALACDPGVDTAFTRAVFRAMWLDSLAGRITDWVLNVDALVLRTLRRMDEDLFQIIGSPSPAPVRPVLPVWARPADVRESIFTNGLAAQVVTLP